MARNYDDTAAPGAAKSTCVMLLLGMTRLIVLGYIVLIAFSFLETQKLLVGRVEMENYIDSGNYYVTDGKNGEYFAPLVMCVPSTPVSSVTTPTNTLTNNGNDEDVGNVFSNSTGDDVMTTTTGDNSTSRLLSDEDVTNSTTGATFNAGTTTNNCHDLNYLIVACASSLVMTCLAALFWIICDCITKSKSCGPFNKHTVAGMGLLLVFCLLQAGISTGALVMQINMWKDDIEGSVISTLQNGQEYDSIQSYANTTILWIATIGSFATALIMVIDAIVYSCVYKPQVKRHSSHMEDVNDAQQVMNQQAVDVENITKGQAPYDFGRSNTAGTNSSNTSNGGGGGFFSGVVAAATPTTPTSTTTTPTIGIAADSPDSLEYDTSAAASPPKYDPFASPLDTPAAVAPTPTLAANPASAAPQWANPFSG